MRISYSSSRFLDNFTRMTFATTYSYSNRKIFDLSTLLKAITFIVANFIVVFTFLFLTLEEFEWRIFSYREQISVEVLDETPWNIKTLIKRYA